MKIHRRAALGIACLCATGTIAAATIPGSFRQIDCEAGGWFEQIIPHSSGRLYGRTDIGGMYRSDDHGDTWQFLSGDLPYRACYYVQGVAVAAGNADIVYQATGVSYAATDPGRGVWKSVDGGTTWTQVLAGVNFSGNDAEHWGGECLVLQPGVDSEVWAGSRGEGLRHSLNAGASWTNLAPAIFDTPNINIAGISIHPSASNTIWVCGGGGVWVSIDHGVNWTKKITATLIYKVVLKADGTAFATGVNNGSNVLYRLTAAGGATDLYPNYIAALPYAPGSDLAMVQLLANGNIWAADLFEFTCRSTDNGNTFTRMPMTLTGALPGWVRPGTTTIEGGRNGLVQDPTNANRLFLGGGYAPFRSDDNGATWRYINHGIGETDAWRVNFHPTDPNRVWLPLADLGVTTVSDGGASGVSSGYIAPQFPYPDDNVMFTHRALVSAAKVIAPGGEQSTHRARIYQTTNNGVTWTKLAGTGLPTADNRELIEAVASADNADDFLVFTAGALSASEGGIYRTTNGGTSFTRSTGFPAGYDPGAELYWNVSLERDATDNTVRYALLRNSGFWKSANRGVTWTKPTVQPAGTFGRLRVDPGTGRIWVGHAFGLEWSANGGASWTLLTALTSVTELDAYNGRIAVIGQKSGDVADHIYVSADNGVNWDEITRSGQRFANAEAVAVDPWRAGTIWISTGGRSIARFTPGSTLQVATAASRKTHGSAGAFDVPLPFTGEPGVECRSSSGSHTLVFTFTNNVVSGTASVTSGTGTVSGASFATNTMTVNLTGVADVQKITVTLSNVTDSLGQILPNTAVSMNLLIGDTNANKSVNATDIGQTKGQSGVAVTTANFRQDVVPGGSINATDVGLIKSRTGASVQ
ncbi:MAG TPA: hypothetical protein VK474_12025 [Chthoniobacterales bacterium]|nr:hypothetical protein [Chthoniobacterales bacterium]